MARKEGRKRRGGEERKGMEGEGRANEGKGKSTPAASPHPKSQNLYKSIQRMKALPAKHLK